MQHEVSVVTTTAMRGTTIPQVQEESLNQMTHGIGLVISIVAAVHLLRLPVSGTLVSAAVWIYAIALIGMYAASTLSHSFYEGALRRRFRTLDQIFIFVFMAAVFTPISVCVCRDGWWNLPLVLMWAMVGIGTWLKLTVTREEMVPVWFYVALGAIPMTAFPRILQVMGADGLGWVLAAGASYLVGILFLTNDHRHPLFHPTWHVFVMIGSACHYLAVCDCVNAAVR